MNAQKPDDKKILARQWKQDIIAASLMPHAQQLVDFVIAHIKSERIKQPNASAIEVDIPRELHSCWRDKQMVLNMAKQILHDEWELRFELVEGCC